MSSILYSTLENDFQRELEGFESVEWQTQNAYISQLENAMKDTQSEQQALHARIEELEHEITAIKMKNAREGAGSDKNSAFYVQQQKRLNTEKEALTEELKSLREIHRVDQDVIVSLQDRLHEMPVEVQKKGILEGQNKQSSDKRSVLIHYMEMVSLQMKRKE
ncbi:hypothetical protein WA577_004667, partial [Blastocystis sp. JDR]